MFLAFIAPNTTQYNSALFVYMYVWILSNLTLEFLTTDILENLPLNLVCIISTTFRMLWCLPLADSKIDRLKFHSGSLIVEVFLKSYEHFPHLFRAPQVVHRISNRVVVHELQER